MRARLSDLDIYKQLHKLACEFEDMAKRAWGPDGATALRAEAERMRILASGLYHASLKMEPGDGFEPPTSELQRRRSTD